MSPVQAPCCWSVSAVLTFCTQIAGPGRAGESSWTAWPKPGNVQTAVKIVKNFKWGKPMHRCILFSLLLSVVVIIHKLRQTPFHIYGGQRVLNLGYRNGNHYNSVLEVAQPLPSRARTFRRRRGGKKYC